MDQNNEVLIKAIKDKVLWHPFDPNKDINFLYEDTEDMIRGQFGQPFHVEELLKNHSISSMKTLLMRTQLIEVE